MKNLKNIVNLIFFVVCFFGFVNLAQATTLYIDPISTNLKPNSEFIAKVKIASPDECINSFDINIEFPKNILKFKDFSIGSSILSLWISKPDNSSIDAINSTGKINFSGGIPGGYCGDVLSEDGENNILGEIIFDVKNYITDNAEIIFSNDSKILANDGFGTSVSFKAKKAIFTVNTNNDIIKKDEWKQRLKDDHTSPEPFLLKLVKNDSVSEGKLFLIFSTTDKQTGMDRYEALEIEKKDLKKYNQKDGFLTRVISLFQKQKDYKWKIVKSPYILNDQSGNSVVKIKAIDKAGNTRTVTYDNGIYSNAYNNKYLYFAIAISFFLLLSVFITILILKRVKK